jgi:hypothetical protein
MQDTTIDYRRPLMSRVSITQKRGLMLIKTA